MNIEIMSKVIIPILGAIVVYVVVPFIKAKTTKEQREKTYFYVKIAVNAAEQIYKEKGQGKLKKEYVLEYIQSLGIKIDMADLEVMMESVVKELENKEIGNIEIIQG